MGEFNNKIYYLFKNCRYDEKFRNFFSIKYIAD